MVTGQNPMNKVLVLFYVLHVSCLNEWLELMKISTIFVKISQNNNTKIYDILSRM